MKNKQLVMLFGLFCLLIQVRLPAVCAELEGFVIPSIAFSRLMIEPGAWCEYLVVEESMGHRDSSVLTVAIPHVDRGGDPGYFWLELKGKPMHGDGGETVIVKLLLSKKIRQFSDRDSLGAYVASIYIKEGEEPVREGDFESLSRLEQESAGDTSSWAASGNERLDIPAGDFSCERFERVLSYEKIIDAKSSTLIQTVSDHHRSWLSGKVPLFQMVRYTVERLRDTRMDPPIAGVPVAGARASNTRVELIGFGTGARTLLPFGN